MKNNKCVCGLVTSTLISTSALAQVQILDKEASPLEVALTAVHTDNLNPTLSEDLSSSGIAVSPKGQLVATSEGVWYLLDYDANFIHHNAENSALDFDTSQSFDSYRGRGLARFFVSPDWFVDVEAQHLKQTQMYGTGISQLKSEVLEADELTQNSAAVTFVYGRETSSRYVSFNLYNRDSDYKAINSYSSLFNATQTGAVVNIGFRQSSLTSLLLRLEGAKEDFDSETREDSNVYRAMVGVDWEPSGKSKIKALVGMYFRDFERQDSSSGFSWSLDFSTRPTEDWLVEVKSNRFTESSQSELTSDSVKQNLLLNVSYHYSDQWQYGVSLSAEKTEFELLDSTSELDRNMAQLNVGLSLKEHSHIQLSLARLDVSNTNNSLDYDQNEVRLTWQTVF